MNVKELYVAQIDWDRRAKEYAPDVRIFRPAPLEPGEIRRGSCPICGERCFYALTGMNGRDLGMTRSAASGAKDGYRRPAIYGEFIFEAPGRVYWHCSYDGESYETIRFALSLMLDDIGYVKAKVERECEQRSRIVVDCVHKEPGGGWMEATILRPKFPEIL